jgi:hypothetical protein
MLIIATAAAQRQFFGGVNGGGAGALLRCGETSTFLSEIESIGDEPANSE